MVRKDHRHASCQLRGLGTVISIYENPFPTPGGLSVPLQQNALKVIRRNVLNTFSAVSKDYRSSPEGNPMMTVQVREVASQDQTHSHVKSADSPSLLLYYLFDDWVTSYALVARREHPYGAELEKLVRQDPLKPNKLTHVASKHV